jgi:hypothetical protein
MLAEKELQGRQSTKMKTSFIPRSASTTPSQTATHFGAHSSMITLASRPPSTLLTPSAPRAMDSSKTSIL